MVAEWVVVVVTKERLGVDTVALPLPPRVPTVTAKLSACMVNELSCVDDVVLPILMAVTAELPKLNVPAVSTITVVRARREAY